MPPPPVPPAPALPLVDLDLLADRVLRLWVEDLRRERARQPERGRR